MSLGPPTAPCRTGRHNSALLPTGTIAARGVLRPPRLLRIPAADRNVGRTGEALQ